MGKLLTVFGEDDGNVDRMNRVIDPSNLFGSPAGRGLDQPHAVEPRRVRLHEAAAPPAPRVQDVMGTTTAARDPAHRLAAHAQAAAAAKYVVDDLGLREQRLLAEGEVRDHGAHEPRRRARQVRRALCLLRPRPRRWRRTRSSSSTSTRCSSCSPPTSPAGWWSGRNRTGTGPGSILPRSTPLAHHTVRSTTLSET